MNSSQTVIIAEGLMMYLKPEAVRDLFSQCAEITGPGSRIVFSYFSTNQDGRPHVGPNPGLMLWLQKVVGEPWLWSIRPQDLGAFLEGLGWKNVESPETKRKYGVEYFAIAEH